MKPEVQTVSIVKGEHSKQRLKNAVFMPSKS